MTTDTKQHTAAVVSAYVSTHQIDLGQLPDLVRSIHAAFAGLGSPSLAMQDKSSLVADSPSSDDAAEPAVLPSKSVFRSYIVCLFCGKKNTMLRRHINSEHGVSPDQYRIKWNLPPSYPMVCPDYAKTRSDLAKQMGLGKAGNRKNPMAKRAARAAS